MISLHIGSCEFAFWFLCPSSLRRLSFEDFRLCKLWWIHFSKYLNCINVSGLCGGGCVPHKRVAMLFEDFNSHKLARNALPRFRRPAKKHVVGIVFRSVVLAPHLCNYGSGLICRASASGICFGPCRPHKRVGIVCRKIQIAQRYEHNDVHMSPHANRGKCASKI